MYVLMTYDAFNGRTEKFRQILVRYLTHEQNSVFAGELTESKLLALRAALAKVAVPEDKILEVTAENRHNVSVSILEKNGENRRFAPIAHNHHKADSAIL